MQRGGSAAHGYFQVYRSLAPLTKAAFLQDPSVKTPVFVRFSTVVGSRGSSDLARDARGFAVKFYTKEGNYDLVGNNIPVFFIQDALKFPDLVHAVKPEPHHEMPQAAAAHDTFWDFISLMPGLCIWSVGDVGSRAPPELRMMEGFAVHTFRLCERTRSRPLRHVSLEAPARPPLASRGMRHRRSREGKDRTFTVGPGEASRMARILNGNSGCKLSRTKDEHKFDFDLLDPHEAHPRRIGPREARRQDDTQPQPDNFFAGGNGASRVSPRSSRVRSDFSKIPSAGRLFSYTDTQLIGWGPQFPRDYDQPADRPCSHNQRDGICVRPSMMDGLAISRTPLGGGCPMQVKADLGGFVSYAEKMGGAKARQRSQSFFDHFSQAALFWHSQSSRSKPIL